jgi:hypothetical protein
MAKGIIKCDENRYEIVVREFLATEYVQCIHYPDAVGVTKGRGLRNSGINKVRNLQFSFL